MLEWSWSVLDDCCQRLKNAALSPLYAHVDTVDYSLDPGFVDRRVELRVSQGEVRAVALDTGELVARHERTFARHVTVTALEHRRTLEEQLQARRQETAIEVRPLERYDALIPA